METQEICGQSMKIGVGVTKDGITIPEFGTCMSLLPCPIHGVQNNITITPLNSPTE